MVRLLLRRGWNQIHTKFPQSKKIVFCWVYHSCNSRCSLCIQLSCLNFTFIFVSLYFSPKSQPGGKSTQLLFGHVEVKCSITLRSFFSSNSQSPPTCSNGSWTRCWVSFQELTKSEFYKEFLVCGAPHHPTQRRITEQESDYGNSYHWKIKLQFNHLLLISFLYWILIHF